EEVLHGWHRLETHHQAWQSWRLEVALSALEEPGGWSLGFGGARGTTEDLLASHRPNPCTNSQRKLPTSTPNQRVGPTIGTWLNVEAQDSLDDSDLHLLRQRRRDYVREHVLEAALFALRLL